MSRRRQVEALLASRLTLPPSPFPLPRKGEAEGGCGVIGLASAEPVAGRHLLSALRQMRNRGNGKGGGVAMVGLVPEQLGVTREALEQDYLLAIAYLDPTARAEVERAHIEPLFEADHVVAIPAADDAVRYPVPPPEVWCYFVRVRPEALQQLATEAPRTVLEDELVYQNSYRLNQAFYATGDKRAFVLSHGKNLLVLKMVGHGDDVIRHYRLEDRHAHVWIGHHRYPTKGRVWHPGGAHPFVGLHEALVHNGDFANYASICEVLAQRNIRPLFLTDTEVSVLVFDLLHRTYGYPLEHVIEALAPTTERDFALLPAAKQRLYQRLQTAHIHGSPDGPWFFLVAQSVPASQEFRLIGITDTSMLRPQVFALQTGSVPIGFAASEKQAIDAALESLAAEDARFWTRADRYWNARGGSHTDGGAFVFEVRAGTLRCIDKFGRPVEIADGKAPYTSSGKPVTARVRLPAPNTAELYAEVVRQIPAWSYDQVVDALTELEAGARDDPGRKRAIEVLTLLMDRRYPTGSLRRSSLLSLYDAAFARVIESLWGDRSEAYVYVAAEDPRPEAARDGPTAVLDARGFDPEGDRSLAHEVVRLHRLGYRKFLVAHARGHRFLANGLGPRTQGVRIDVYGSSGDYLASGLDGAVVVVHGSGQDQLAQIMKDGTLVVYGDVGQTFMYAAKGGRAFVLGNAAGRPLINAVGRPRVVINGTCLDYLAESFMAGDPLNGGGFVILNGIALGDDGAIRELDTPYPGGNLFSLASGGAIYMRDPRKAVSDDQLNGGELVELADADWDLMRPYLEENARLFGIPVAQLLVVDGLRRPPRDVYRKIRPGRIRALEPEEAWVRQGQA
ncbi:MAG: glutamate synthase [Gemmatimonadales bacterium]